MDCLSQLLPNVLSLLGCEEVEMKMKKFLTLHGALSHPKVDRKAILAGIYEANIVVCGRGGDIVLMAIGYKAVGELQEVYSTLYESLEIRSSRSTNKTLSATSELTLKHVTWVTLASQPFGYFI